MNNKLTYHLLPTEDASILFLYPDGQLLRSPKGNQHLYICSDSHPIKGDWYWSKKDGRFYKWGINYTHDEGDKKIILTTDPKLDGVEKIDGNTKAIVKNKISFAIDKQNVEVNFLTEFCKRWNEKRSYEVYGTENYQR